MKRTIVLLSVVLRTLSGIAQTPSDTLTLHFSPLTTFDGPHGGAAERIQRLQRKRDKPHYIYIENFTVGRYLATIVTGNPQLMYKKYRLTLPEKLNADTAMGVVYVFCELTEFKKTGQYVPCLLSSAYDENPLLYADLNGNLDFSDDGEPIHFRDSRAMLRVPPTLSTSDTLLYALRTRDSAAIRFAQEIHEENQQDIEQSRNPKRLKRIQSRVKADYFPRTYGIATENYALRIADTMLNGTPVRLGWNDLFHNGNFTNTIKNPHPTDSDLLFLPESGAKISIITANVEPALGTPVVLGGKTYAIAAMHPHGDWMKFVPTQAQTSYMRVGSLFPVKELEHLDLKTHTKWEEIKDTSRYTLVDIWGSWCKGCIAGMPELVRLDSLYGDNIQLIGITTDSPEQLEKIKQRFHAHWQQFHLTQDLEKRLHIVAFPTLYLLDKKGNLLELNPDIKELESRLQVEKQAEYPK